MRYLPAHIVCALVSRSKRVNNVVHKFHKLRTPLYDIVDMILETACRRIESPLLLDKAPVLFILRKSAMSKYYVNVKLSTYWRSRCPK
jgi:hypothetical protein